MRMGQGVRTGLGHVGITCVLQTQFFSFFSFFVSFEIILRQQNNCFTPCWSIGKKTVAIGFGKDKINF